MSVRESKITLALSSIRDLRQVIGELTEEELQACLQFECESRRRKSVYNALIAKLAELNRQTFITHLKEKYKWPVDPRSS
jgi:hypothetical protein